jgi:ribosome-associated heat shock protein Hsp15
LAGPRGRPDPTAALALRLDKWLWQARFYKSRSIAAEAVESGSVRINGQRVGKPSHALRVGDVLTLPLGPRVRLIRVVALGLRRGPATEALLLYCDLDGESDDAPA